MFRSPLLAYLAAIAVAITIPLRAQSPEIDEFTDAVRQLQQQLQRIQSILNRLSREPASGRPTGATTAEAWQEARKYYEAGIQAEKDRKFAEAVEAFTQSLKIDPSNDAAYLHRGAAYLGWGRAVESIADVSQSLRLQPNNAEAYRLRALAYAAVSRNIEAAADLAEAVRRTGVAAEALKMTAEQAHVASKASEAVGVAAEKPPDAKAVIEPARLVSRLNMEYWSSFICCEYKVGQPLPPAESLPRRDEPAKAVIGQINRPPVESK